MFSLGIMLVELATGKHPFLADTATATTIAITQSELNYTDPAVPGGKAFASLLRRMLDKNPSRRPSMLEVGRSLERIASLQSRRTRRRVIWSAGAVVAAMIVAALLWLHPGRPAAPLLGSRVAITDYSGIEQQPAFSPDGRTLAFVWSGRDGCQDDLYIRPAAAMDAPPCRLTDDPNEEFSPAWSPDGKFLVWRWTALDGGDGEL